MKIIHVASPSLLLLLNERLDIVGIWRVSRQYRAPQCVTRITYLTSTPDGTPELSADTFRTDGLGRVRLLWWTLHRHANASPATQFYRFRSFFDGDPTDAITAAMRVFAGTDSLAPGEQSHFCGQQWKHHPDEMAALALLGKMIDPR